ncbi:unnamed protein product [Prunus armeniaca]
MANVERHPPSDHEPLPFSTPLKRKFGSPHIFYMALPFGITWQHIGYPMLMKMDMPIQVQATWFTYIQLLFSNSTK